MDRLQRPARLSVVESAGQSSKPSHGQNGSNHLPGFATRDGITSGPNHRNSIAGPSSAMAVNSGPTGRSTSTSTSTNANTSEESKLIRAEKRRKEVLRKGEKWADRMMEETVEGLGDFKRGLRYLSPAQYALITHERHLNSLCSYPPCPKRPSAAYRPGKRFVISSKHRTITETMGNAEEGYCSKVCRARSTWVEGELGKAGAVLARGKDWEVELELMEEFEERRGMVGNGDKSGSGSTPRMVSGSTTSAAETVSSGDSPTLATKGHSSPPGGSDRLFSASSSRTTPQKASATPIVSEASTVRHPTRPAIPLPLSTPADLIASLTIHERPTVPIASQPTALSKDQSSLNTPSSASGSGLSIPSPSRREASSLVATPSGLATTVLKASKTIGRNQLDPDSEDEAADVHLEWEKEVGLDWGGGEGDEEMRDVWEDARRAKELMDEEDVG